MEEKIKKAIRLTKLIKQLTQHHKHCWLVDDIEVCD